MTTAAPWLRTAPGSKATGSYFWRNIFGPPRAPLALRVGVTGHRPDDQRTPPDVGEIRKTARKILRCIRDACEGVADTFGDEFHPLDTSEHPHPGKLRVISALAAGSDQWLAEEAIELKYELQCPLPFSRDEYRKDFDGDEESHAVTMRYFSRRPPFWSLTES